MTNVPPVVFGPNGFQAPSQAAILAGVQADINEAFGGNLNPSLDTPQGQLATSITAIIGQVNDTFVDITNQTNPDFATGRWQDAIGELYFLQRQPSEPTVVQAVCTGGNGVVIPAGSLAQAADGNIYTCTDGGTIPVEGTITLSFSCNVVGPIACPSDTLTIIYRSIPGWDTINNPSDGVLGNEVESRAEYKERMAASVAVNSRSSIASILGAVLAIPGVLDAYATENVSDIPTSIGGALLVAHSLYVAAIGGDSQAIADAIWSKKAPGCDYNGNTTVTVIDNDPRYSPPQPSYEVSFEIPDSLPILFAVSIANNAQVPADAATQIQNAIINAFAGADGGSRARIGSVIYASRYYAPIAALGSWAEIISLQLGSSNSKAVEILGRISGTTLTVDSVVSGAVAIGQTVSDTLGNVLAGTVITAGAGTTWTVSKTAEFGATFTGTGAGTNLTVTAVTGTIEDGQRISGTGVPANTVIVSQTSGTIGGAGVYVTNNATTSSGNSLKASEDLYGSLANQNSVTVDINQVPTVNADNIVVTVI